MTNSNSSKWSYLDEDIKRVILTPENKDLGYTALARKVLPNGEYADHDLLRTYIRKNFEREILLSKGATEEMLEEGSSDRLNGYVNRKNMSALSADGKVMSIEEYCEHYGIPFEDVKSYKLVSHTGEPIYNIASHTIKGEGYEEFYKNLIEEIKEFTPKWDKVVRPSYPDEDAHLLVVDPADVHVGKLSEEFETGETYDSDKAVQRTLEGVAGLIKKAKGFDIDQVMFVAGNDILHTDNAKRTTTAGTPQDTHGSWFSNFLKAKQLYVDCVMQLLEVAPVHFVFNPSNHDFMSGFFLADVIQTYFKDNDDVTFDADMKHRKYYRYGNNLIGTTHGDGAKQADLGPLMAHEAKEWSECKHRYIYTHHIHHKTSKDMIGVTIESLRSPSASDAWHHRNGYTGVPKAIEGFLHSKTNGQIARFTHLF